MTRLEWLQWRKEGIGGSDAPIVMGVSPWKTIEQLYEEKISPEIKDDPPNYQQERGIRMEPRIRSLYEILVGESFEPALLKMHTLPFMRLSLDGKSQDAKRIIEIKVSGKADWTASKEQSIVPKKYYPQIQHALLISGAEFCWYLSYLWTKEEEKILDKEKLAVVTVFPDKEYQKILFEKCSWFWNECVLPRNPPNSDEKRPNLDETERGRQILEWKILQEQIKELEGRQNKIRQDLLEYATKRNFKEILSNGVKISQHTKSGNVDYKNIPELQGVDLEQYRGKPITYWKMEIQK